VTTAHPRAADDRRVHTPTPQEAVDMQTPTVTEIRPPIQILTKSDITFDPTQGWKAYPDFAQRFAKQWGAGQ
jgi:hypothetical protein